MQALDYLLPGPPFSLTAEQRAACLELLDATPPGGFIDYHLALPRWQFLSQLCRSRDLVLHGSQDLGIQEVEPRKAVDARAFSAQEAIYATTDGIWAIFFSIVDRRKQGPLSLFNSCMDIRLSSSEILGPLYFFSISCSALRKEPWCPGAVYILPRAGFLHEPARQISGVEITFPHWLGFSPCKPIAKLQVRPWDFPFLARIHGHDDEQLARLAAANPDGFPWPEALDHEYVEQE